MVHWIWAVSPKKWWFATVHWYHHLLKNCWLFLMISHHIPIIHHYIYIYICIPIPSLSLWSHQISWWNDHSSPLNSCKRTPFILLQIIWGTKQVYSKYPNGTSMQKVLQLWVFTGSTHPFYGSTEGQPVADPFAVLLGEAEALHLRSQAIEDGVGNHLSGTAPVHVTPGASNSGHAVATLRGKRRC